MNEMTKVAGQVPGIMQEAAQHMRKLAEDNVSLSQECDALRKQLTVEKIARRMEQRGLEPELDFDGKVAKLASLEPSKLATMEQAIELAGGSFRLGRVQDADKTASDGSFVRSGSSADDLDNFFASNAAYE